MRIQKNECIKLKTYDFFLQSQIAFVKLDCKFTARIKELINNKYGSIRKFADQYNDLNRNTLHAEFYRNQYFRFSRIAKIAKRLGLDLAELYGSVQYFFAKGSNTHRKVFLPPKIVVNEKFVEGFALYLAEGDNGSNGYTSPRKVRMVNSELSVLKLFQEWLETFFHDNGYYLKIVVPYPKELSLDHYSFVKNYFELPDTEIKVVKFCWKRKTDFIYRICCDSSLLVDLILSLKNQVKSICMEDKKLAEAYIRGMMIGEGTVYFNKSRYVRIEMKNESEIKYLARLFDLLGLEYKIFLRSNRENMWSIYIGAKQLRKYHDKIGFGVHERKQRILRMAAHKKLKINQYG
tara:strand:+ start:4413 stop:5456 length:1044 start_codon:yes stop_codon:yes gene_type:complete